MDEQTFTRTFEAELAGDGDGRTIIGRCVPFDTPATVSDPPRFEPYQELFRAGAFKAATRAPNRVLLDFEHDLGIGGVLGHGVELEERSDGLYGSFRVLDHPDGDKALAMVREKILTGFSVMFRSLRSMRSPAGQVERLRVHLDRVALCRLSLAAYEESQVLAVRHRPPPAPLMFDPQLVERLEQLNVEIPDTLRVS
jgi:HK97 family phage prohead protease